MGRTERVNAIAALEAARGGSTVIAYVTSTRPGMESQMAPDAIPRLYEHLRKLPKHPSKTTIDLFLHSNGGDGTVPWRLVTLVREFCSELNVLVPHHAFSAATLTALGADRVVMHPMGMLGPTDPSITTPFNPQHPVLGTTLPVSVEDVASYIALIKEDVGIRHEDELVQTFLALADKIHPLALGSVKRSTSQSRMLGEKLLRRRAGAQMASSSIEEVVRKLTSELFFHGHPINRQEARQDVGLEFVEDASPEVAEAMWSLYEQYRSDYRYDEPLNPLQEAIAKNPLPVPPPTFTPEVGYTPTHVQATVTLDPFGWTIVESRKRCDVFEGRAELTILRDHLGNYQSGQPQVLTQGWVIEADEP